MQILPSSNGGQLLTKDDIVAAMVREGIKYGVDESKIQDF